MIFSPISELFGRKIALMSDIHGNYHAFRACSDDAIRQGAEGFLFLGDYVSDLAEPERTMDLLYELQAAYPTVCLIGNRERYMLERERGDASFVPGSRSGSLLFTFQHLRKRDLDFFRGLKISDTIALNGIPVEMAHAAMDNDRFYFDSTDGNASQIFPNMKCDYLFTGHSHKQFALREHGKTILNPGSVGLPHDGSPLAQYALLETCQGAISWELRQVQYDLEAVVHAQFARGLVDCAQYWAIGILYDVLTGEERVMKLLNRVLEAGDPQDEALWCSAAMAMGMREREAEILDFGRSRTFGKSSKQERIATSLRSTQ